MATNRAQYAVAFLQRLGWAPHQAAAIVGHLQQESGRNLNTTIRGDGGHSVGIAQWHRERGRSLQSWSSRQGLDWSDLDTQLRYLDHELKTTERAAGQRLRAAGDIYSATAAFGGFERPQGYSASNPERMHGWRNRLSNAQTLAGMNIDPGSIPAAGGQAGTDPNIIRDAQRLLREQGYDVPVSGALDEATLAGVKAFRSSVGGMAFAQRYGLPVQPPAQPAAYAPAQQQAPAVQAVNAMAQGQPPMLDARPQRTVPGAPSAYAAEAQPYRGPPPGTDPATLMQPMAEGPRRVEVARFNNAADPVSGPAMQMPPVVQMAQAAPPRMPWEEDDQMSRHGIVPPPAPPPASTPPPYLGGVGGAAAAEYATDDNPIMLDQIDTFTSMAPIPSLTPQGRPTIPQDPGTSANNALMIAARQPPQPLVLPPQYNVDYMNQQPVRSVADMLGGLPASPNMPEAPPPAAGVPVEYGPPGGAPMPRPHPIPMAQRPTRSGNMNGYQWSHIPQKGGPTMLAVTTPQGRKWRTPLGPPGGAGLFNEYMSSFVPVIRG